MATKSIIDIDVNDAAFLRFQAQFQNYVGQLATTPAAWQQANAAAASTATSVQATAAATTAAAVGAGQVAASTSAAAVAAQQASVAFNSHIRIVNNMGREQKAGAQAAKEQAFHWDHLSRSAKSFASHIGDATRSLLRWASLTGLISGILGGGGLFGIERLATAAGDQKRSTLGLGITPGEQKAFETNFGRVVNPDSLLGGVNQALTDPSKRSALYGAGLTERDLQGKDAAQVSVEALSSIKKLVDHTNTNMLGTLLTARRLDQLGLSEEDLRRLKDTPEAELNKYGSDFAKDRRDMELDKPTQDAWQDLQVQLHRAATTIEQTFITGLTPLAKPIEDVSKGFTDLVAAFLKNPDVKVWIQGLADSLETFAKYVSTPQFKDDIDVFVTGIGKLAAAIKHGLQLIGLLAPDKEETAKDNPALRDPEHHGGQWPVHVKNAWQEEEDRRLQKQKEWDDAHPGVFTPPKTTAPGGPLPWGGSTDPSFHWQWPHIFGGSSGAASASPAAFRPGGDFQVDNSLLASVEYQESRGKDVTNAQSGAAGYFQFMPATAKQYGVNVHDEQSSLEGARKYLTDLTKQFGGSIEKALAAYNWGPGNLAKDIRTYGDDWRSHLPQETKRYVAEILGRIAPSPGQAQRGAPKVTEINIRNNTGGSAVVSASQLNT